MSSGTATPIATVPLVRSPRARKWTREAQRASAREVLARGALTSVERSASQFLRKARAARKQPSW